MLRTLFGAPGQTYQVGGHDYFADGSGRIDGVPDQDVGPLLQSGCTEGRGVLEFSGGSVGPGLIAVGTSVNDALPLPAQYNLIVWSSPGSGVILPPVVSIGSGMVLVYNSTTLTINVYAADTLDGFPAGTPSLLASGCLGFYFSSSDDVTVYVSAVVADTRLVGKPTTVSGGLNLIGHLLGADMNSVTDQPVEMLVDAQTPFRVRQITVTNASGLLDTASGGIYTDVNKGGTAIVSAGQGFSDLSAPNIAVDLDIVPTPGNTIWDAATQLYVSLSVPQGVAGVTADYYFYGAA